MSKPEKKPDSKKKSDRKKKLAELTSKKKKKDKKGPWYRDGLRFECTQCGACCGGEPGYVWVDPEEIEAMAKELDIDVIDFEAKYTRQVGNAKSLKEYENGDCVLLDQTSRKCTVYEGRPIQCRTWPFWDSNLEKKKDWKETCEVCPGAGVGTLYSFEHIEITRREKAV
ncbi:YkgJ family cysteine cluster protein [Rubripirellula amarantea]|nr:YkgJ family cysteine cluster protein [Rubripirellula amarantea]